VTFKNIWGTDKFPKQSAVLKKKPTYMKKKLKIF